MASKLLLAALLTLVATAASAAPRIQPRPCHVDGVAEALRCADYDVPENRALPNGRKLTLHIVVIPARKPAPGALPDFVLFGGPGEAATDGVADFATTLWERNSRDVVLFDVRGSSRKDGLVCDFSNGDKRAQAQFQPLLTPGKDYRTCRDALEKHADLAQYTTPAFVADLDEVRQAMGYDKIDLEAGSYGTRFGLAYLHSHGSHVAAALLTGLVPTANIVSRDHAKGDQRAFDKLAARCAAEPACHAAFPDVDGDLAAILADLGRKPVQVSVTNPLTGKPDVVTIDAANFAEKVRVMLYSTRGQGRLPLLLHQARGGDFRPFAEAGLKNSLGVSDGIRLALYLSVGCAEDAPRFTAVEAAAEARGTFVGDGRGKGLLDACADWPKGVMPKGYFAPFRSQVPVLLVSGDYDPITPPSWGELVRKSFPNSVHLIVPLGHTEENACVDELGEKLFRTRSVKDLDTSCAAKVKPAPFVLPDASPNPG